jgi:DNA-binding protein
MLDDFIRRAVDVNEHVRNTIFQGIVYN